MALWRQQQRLQEIFPFLEMSYWTYIFHQIHWKNDYFLSSTQADSFPCITLWLLCSVCWDPSNAPCRVVLGINWHRQAKNLSPFASLSGRYKRQLPTLVEKKKWIEISGLHSQKEDLYKELICNHECADSAHNLQNMLLDPWALSVLSAKCGNSSQHTLHKGITFLGACLLYTALRGHTAATNLVKILARGLVIDTLEEGPKPRSRIFNLLALSDCGHCLVSEQSQDQLP